MTRRQWVGLGVTLLTGVGGLLGGSGHTAPSLSRYAGAVPAGRVLVPALAAGTSRPAPAQGAGMGPAPLVGNRPRVAAPTPDYQLAAPPSVSTATLDRVLAAYHSPAAGSGALFYDRGVATGIDPAYALAFFIVESQAGTQGVARFTYSIGNIRATPGDPSYAGYRRYPTYAAGITDWYALIKTLYIAGWGLTTPDAILPRYAPWGDNNHPAVYAATVKALVARWQP